MVQTSWTTSYEAFDEIFKRDYIVTFTFVCVSANLVNMPIK